MLTVKVEAKDPAGIKTVYLKHKPFPSTYDWETVPMQKKDGVWISSLEISPVGALWSIGALDADNNGSMWPDFRNDIPYRMVAPWESTF